MWVGQALKSSPDANFGLTTCLVRSHGFNFKRGEGA